MRFDRRTSTIHRLVALILSAAWSPAARLAPESRMTPAAEANPSVPMSPAPRTSPGARITPETKTRPAPGVDFEKFKIFIPVPPADTIRNPPEKILSLHDE
uniref:Uncharacterized protein n=1 Tax=Bracon brevicornis TaxID=1563983 RepID=A0A6V7KPG4_9HYME